MKVWGITGWKNTGKTGLTERLVAHFTELGLVVSTIKHAHETADVDHAGTDSYRHRAAGASQVVLSSPKRVAVMQELRGAPEPSLDDLIARLSPCDLVLVEGFKRDAHPKVETYRAEAGRDLIAPNDATIKAVASDSPLDCTQPVFDLDDTAKIANFIAAELSL